MASNKKKTSFYLDEEVAELLRRVAFYKNETKTKVINDFLVNYLKKELEKFEKEK